ncbi:MAG: FAD-dependent oxidoreductase [Verrucomicrobiaceae bacterium]|nr:FAD-dependent oxidoreductase [Verrucomicrobiaceae bacterium]
MNRRRFIQVSAVAPALMLGSCRNQVVPGSIIGAAHRAGHLLRDGKTSAAPSKTAKTDVLILGGGVAGLAAARQLARRGITDFLVLELESQSGGNSQGGRNSVSAYPWGAHYVTLPGPDCHEVRELFEELGLIAGHDAAGRPIYDELALCADPQERLFIHGQWQEGIAPSAGLTSDEQRQFREFREEMSRWSETKGADGRPAFTIPVDRSSRDPTILELDQLTMAAWMDAKGWTCEPLRWQVDYSCRDDFGGGEDEVSAWAGIHYFASRRPDAANADHDTVLTWPEGNAWLAERLAESAKGRIRNHALVLNVTEQSSGVQVDVMNTTDGHGGEIMRFVCRAVVCAMPRFIAQRIISNLKPLDQPPVYSPWVVANLALDELPPSPGELPAWDNVVYGGPSLGYVNATHQNLTAVPRETVITHYEALCGSPPARLREWMLTQTHAQWCDRIFSALAAPHPDLAAHVQNIDVWLWGHGMVRPTPGFISGTTRTVMQQHQPPVFFAHSDMSGVSLFEEAFTRGTQAADAAIRFLG